MGAAKRNVGLSENFRPCLFPRTTAPEKLLWITNFPYHEHRRLPILIIATAANKINSYRAEFEGKNLVKFFSPAHFFAKGGARLHKLGRLTRKRLLFGRKTFKIVSETN